MPTIPKSLANTITTLIRVPEARVLSVLVPSDRKGYWPVLPRQVLAAEAGFVPTTGTINRVLNGVPAGSSSGPASPGLLKLGLVSKVVIDLDGETQDCYKATPRGAAALDAFLAARGGAMPPVRDRSSSTNKRYDKAHD